jgi:hypothetical protein
MDLKYQCGSSHQIFYLKRRQEKEKKTQEMKFEDSTPAEFELWLLQLGAETRSYGPIDQNA